MWADPRRSTVKKGAFVDVVAPTESAAAAAATAAAAAAVAAELAIAAAAATRAFAVVARRLFGEIRLITKTDVARAQSRNPLRGGGRTG